MYSPEKLGRRLTEHRKTRALSAYAAARAAGLSDNYYRLMERGIRKPSADAVAAIATALQLTPAEGAELRRLAGIDPDPGATEEAVAARRDAWRELTYILAVHYLLPREEVDGLLHGSHTLATHDRDLVQRALDSADLSSFVQAAGDRPPRGRLRTLIDEVFRDAPLSALVDLRRNVNATLYSQAGGDRYYWWERWAIARVLLGHNCPSRSEVELHQYVHEYAPDYSFGVCAFSPLLWQVCRHRPFEAVALPFARLCIRGQRTLYDAARAGLSLEDFDRGLLGVGPIGEQLRELEPSRPSLSELADPPDWLNLPLQLRPGSVSWINGPRSPVDLVFDELDRTEFLQRFPLFFVDREWAAAHARSRELATWSAWREYLSTYTATLAGRPSRAVPPDSAPFTPERFVSVLHGFRSRSGTAADVNSLRSWIGRRLATEGGHAIANLFAAGDWRNLISIAAALELPPDWQQILQALRDNNPAP